MTKLDGLVEGLYLLRFFSTGRYYASSKDIFVQVLALEGLSPSCHNQLINLGWKKSEVNTYYYPLNPDGEQEND